MVPLTEVASGTVGAGSSRVGWAGYDEGIVIGSPNDSAAAASFAAAAVLGRAALWSGVTPRPPAADVSAEDPLGPEGSAVATGARSARVVAATAMVLRLARVRWRKGIRFLSWGPPRQEVVAVDRQNV
ncbi:hypothetical protein GCM10009719_04900 [Nocardioides kribbensis]